MLITDTILLRFVSLFQNAVALVDVPEDELFVEGNTV